MDGLEATRLIRQKDDKVPIIVLTAYAVRSLKKDAAEAGCTDILTKPASAKQINATIRKYMK
jgi:Response regulators consisting of a CheY-like receiver domain and a winged-helix DNA-binding domain